MVTKKTRLVINGAHQVAGEYWDTYSPVVDKKTFRMFLSIAANYDLDVHQFDIVTAFLSGELEEDIYMEVPQGYWDFHENQWEGQDVVLKLNKALYGLKQAPLKWNQRFNQFMISNGYSRATSDPCLYYKFGPNRSMTLLVVQLDDSNLASNDPEEMANQLNPLKGLCKELLNLYVKF